ncbi:MAG: RICIN domain-containing protein [Armatimonadota bacterium]
MLLILLSHFGSGSASAQDANLDQWSGEKYLLPVSSPDMVLEAVNSGTSDGTVVSIGKPTGAANQKWVFTSRGNGQYSIRPSYSTELVLTVQDGGTANGTQLVLARDQGLDWQLWSIKPNGSGKLSIVPKHAPLKGIDDFGGGETPGSRQDIWDWNEGDVHLQWSIVSTKDGVPVPIPRGRITTGTFNQSKIYPGTIRQYWVYVPAQYDPAKPACVYVQQDGFGNWEARVLDELIASKEMPVTVGVFVSSGWNPAPTGMDTCVRRNRDFEYDAMGDNYVRFITEEILPYVAKMEKLNLSTKANDRCIGGGSSGGICAFNAAWERPDAVSRVYAVSGSFVAFRGAHEFPTLVRKTEPKPIRAFLTTGTHDMENCAGDWTLLDLEMEKSLKFCGYDYVFHTIEGGHGAGGGPSGLMEGLRFLWKGWPEPVKAGAGAPRAQDILVPGQPWKLCSGGYKRLKGAAANSKGEVFFIDTATNRIDRIGLDGHIQPFIKDALHANGLSFGPKDELYTASTTTGKVMCYDAMGKGKVCAEGLKGQYILAKPDGGVYVTSPGAAGQPSTLWLVKDGKKSKLDTVAKSATGLAMRPDQWLLAVADKGSKWIYSYQVNPDGTVAHRERFFWLHVADWDDDAGTEALCYDREGHLFAATRMGIQVCADDGPTQVIIPVPKGRVTGICIGGAEMNTLYAFCGDKIYQRPIKGHTMGAFTPWTKVDPTPL